MQTFLPYADYVKSATCLDWRRLGKQRLECKQILRALGVQVGDKPLTVSGWRNHPAVRMWRGYERALCWYAMTVCTEWIERGYNDSLISQFATADGTLHLTDYKDPPWFGDANFHASHKSNLKRKDIVHYGCLWPEIPADLPYIWPV